MKIFNQNIRFPVEIWTKYLLNTSLERCCYTESLGITFIHVRFILYLYKYEEITRKWRPLQVSCN
jgi:hypothetical protein